MPLVNSSIPNLAQGVSQQPDNLRFAGQHEAQENMLSSVVDGLRKRPFTEFVGELGTGADIDPDSFVYLINRDSSNRHLLVIEPNSIAPKIYDTTDGSLINTYAASTGTGTPNISYITEANPRKNLRAITVADTTFILNKTQSISALGTDSDAQANKAMVFVKQGDYLKNYNVDISVGGTKYHCTYKTGDGANVFATINGATITGNDHGLSSKNAEDASSELIAQGLFGAITGSLSSILNDFTITLANLEGAIGGPPANDFSAATNGSAVLIEYHGQAQFEVTVHDGVGDNGLGVAYKEVSSITDLPVKAFHGLTVKVTGDVELAADDYYVKFVEGSASPSTDDYGDGKWVETIAPDTPTALTATEMPYKLLPQPHLYIDSTNIVSGGSSYTDGTFALAFTGGGTPTTEAEGTFTVSSNEITSINITNAGAGYSSAPTLDFSASAGGSGEDVTVTMSDGESYYIDTNTWGTRLVGDTETNPDPSFVGSTIENIFFWKNRLGFLSGQNIIFSEADNYYNFFRTTVLQLLDSAPIDVGISHTKVSNLKHVATFQEKLIVFSDETQFVIKGNELLTASTINVTPTTEYTALAGVEPLTQGNFIYFPFPRNSFSGVNEYAIDLNTDTFRGEEITGQVPKYIPADIKQLIGSPTEDIMVATTSNGSGTTDLYVYKYFWRGNERVQSAWSKFSFQDEIVHAFFIESDLYLVTKDGTSTYLEKMSLESGLVDTGETYAIHLDKRRAVSGLSPTYDSGTDKTTIDAGYPIANAEVWSQGGTKATKDGSSSGTTIVVNGDYSTDSYVGIPYTSTVTFTRPTIKQSADGQGRSVSGYSHQIVRNGSIEYANTGHFKVSVATKFRSSYEHIFNANILGANTQLGQLVLQDGTFQFPVYANVNDITVAISSNSALPMQLLASEFESTIASRSRRIAS